MTWIKVSDQLPEDGQIVEVEFGHWQLKDVIFKKMERGYEFFKNNDSFRGLRYTVPAEYWREQK